MKILHAHAEKFTTAKLSLSVSYTFQETRQSVLVTKESGCRCIPKSRLPAYRSCLSCTYLDFDLDLVSPTSIDLNRKYRRDYYSSIPSTNHIQDAIPPSVLHLVCHFTVPPQFITEITSLFKEKTSSNCSCVFTNMHPNFCSSASICRYVPIK